MSSGMLSGPNAFPSRPLGNSRKCSQGSPKNSHQGNIPPWEFPIWEDSLPSREFPSFQGIFPAYAATVSYRETVTAGSGTAADSWEAGDVFPRRGNVPSGKRPRIPRGKCWRRRGYSGGKCTIPGKRDRVQKRLPDDKHPGNSGNIAGDFPSMCPRLG